MDFNSYLTVTQIAFQVARLKTDYPKPMCVGGGGVQGCVRDELLFLDGTDLKLMELIIGYTNSHWSDFFLFFSYHLKNSNNKNIGLSS